MKLTNYEKNILKAVEGDGAKSIPRLRGRVKQLQKFAHADKMRKTKDFESYWIGKLKDKEQAAEYINAALEDGDHRVFLTVLREVAEAQGGFTRLAKITALNRSNLNKMLSDKGHPEIQTLERVLEAFGLQMKVYPKPAERRLKKAA